MIGKLQKSEKENILTKRQKKKKKKVSEIREWIWEEKNYKKNFIIRIINLIFLCGLGFMIFYLTIIRFETSSLPAVSALND